MFDKGLYEIRFVNDSVAKIDVKRSITDREGRVLFLEGPYGHIFNFNNIISLRKVD